MKAYELLYAPIIAAPLKQIVALAQRGKTSLLCASARTGTAWRAILGLQEELVQAEPTIHTTMDELLERWPSARAPLARHGMACVGCPMARFETLGEAAAAYGFDPCELLSAVTPRLRKPRTARHTPR